MARRILIDLRLVHGQMHGIARYALELARRLPKLAPSGWQFEALVAPEGLPKDLGALTPEIPTHACRAHALSVLEQPALTASLLKVRPDLFHATSFSLPALWPGTLVATLHDANHLALKHEYGVSQAAYYKAIVAPRAARAEALITVSEFSRGELAKHLALLPECFQVIPNGVDARFRPVPAREQIEARQRYGLPDRYVLVVGNEKPFKNLDLAARVADHLPIPMAVLAGSAKVRYFPATAVHLRGVLDADLPAIYSGASFLLFPSRYEGFGLPAIEAMACGCPVICADGSSLPEIVGNAAIRLPPADEEAWVETSLRLLRDERARAELSQKGLARADLFSWDRSAQAHLNVYRRVLRE